MIELNTQEKIHMYVWDKSYVKKIGHNASLLGGHDFKNDARNLRQNVLNYFSDDVYNNVWNDVCFDVRNNVIYIALYNIWIDLHNHTKLK